MAGTICGAALCLIGLRPYVQFRLELIFINQHTRPNDVVE